MSDGLKLISSIVSTGSSNTLLRLDREKLTGDEQSVFDFVYDHHRRYQAMPDASTVNTEVGVRLPAAPEALQYYIDQIDDRYTFNEVRTRYAELRAAMTDRDIEGMRPLIAEMNQVMGARRVRGQQVASMGEGLAMVVDRLVATRGYGGITGIETPWATYNEITSGYQNSDLITIAGRPGTAKCMHPDTPVLMHSGAIKAIKTVRVGDYLMGPDSAPRRVLSTTTGREQMYTIVPFRGERWTCNGSHILVLRCRKNLDKKHTKESTHIYSVNEYLALPSRVQRSLMLVRAGVEFSATSTEYDPYLIGLWLGDGCMANGRISTIDAEIHQALRGYAAQYGYRLVQCERRPGFCPTYAFADQQGKENELRWYFRERCIRDGEKRIPWEHLRNSSAHRLQLLAGLIDTDGSLSKTGTYYTIVTKFDGLCDDILYLARSLGFGAHAGVTRAMGREYHRITITGNIDIVPCKLPRKQAQERPDVREDALCSTFEVVSQGEGEYFGVTLDKDHLYLLGDFTVTHNTYNLLVQAMTAHDAGHSVLIVTTEMGIEQISRRYVALKLGINPDYMKRNMLSTYSLNRIRALGAEMMQDERLKIFSIGMGAKLSAIEALMQEFGPSIVFLDGTYLVHPTIKTPMKRIERVAETFDELKGLTLSANIPIVNTMQFNRQAGKDGKEGSLENIGFTDAVGMHSSLVIGLRMGPTEDPRRSRTMEFMKGREGEVGEVHMHFQFAPVNMSELDPALIVNGENGAPAAEAGTVDINWMA